MCKLDGCCLEKKPSGWIWLPVTLLGQQLFSQWNSYIFTTVPSSHHILHLLSLEIDDTPEAFHSETDFCKSVNGTVSDAHKCTGCDGKPFPWEFIRTLSGRVNSRSGVPCGIAVFLKVILLAPVLLFGNRPRFSGRFCVVADKLFILTIMWGFSRVLELVVPWFITPQYEHSWRNGQRLLWMLSMEKGVLGFFLNNYLKNGKS